VRSSGRSVIGLVAACALVAASAGAGAQAPQEGPPRVGPPGFPRVPPLPVPATPQVFDTLTGAIRVVPLAIGLANPWSLAFLPDGDMLVTERPGRLRIVRNGTLDPQPIAGVPEVHAIGQGGLLEVALHPRFAENRLVYLTYAKPGERGGATALARGRFEGSSLSDLRDIFVADNWSMARAHFGSKIAFGRDGMLYMTVGERTDRNRAQDPGNHAGKILRLRDDGTVPPDNPLAASAGHRPEIYSYGHRNPQGLAVHPETGALWAVEHGPQGGDELNVILPGRNYGWPIVSFGREYSGEVISAQPFREGMEQPMMHWVPSIGISGLAIYTGDRLPGWKGNAFVGGLSGQVLQRLVFTEKGPIGRESLLGPLRQRIRDVRQGSDGLLYLLTDSDPGAILRIEPAK
jgi:glucose/arabinose dehydrogenase